VDVGGGTRRIDHVSGIRSMWGWDWKHSSHEWYQVDGLAVPTGWWTDPGPSELTMDPASSSPLCIHLTLFMLGMIPGLSHFHRSSRSVYFCECKLKNRNQGRPGTMAVHNRASSQLAHICYQPTVLKVYSWLVLRLLYVFHICLFVCLFVCGFLRPH